MPDISMCLNKTCPKKAECYRYTAKPSMYQSYCAFEYKDGCEHYMPNQAKECGKVVNKLIEEREK